MIHVTTLDDPRVADYRLLAEPAALGHANLFVVEGRLNVRRLLTLPRFRTRSVLITPAALDVVQGAEGRPDGAVPIILVDQSLMNQIAGFNIHRGCVALADRPAPTALADLPLGGARRLLVLEGVNNPDNIGGLFRSAAAFGVEAVILGPACSDPLYRKAIRTSMGATLQVPFAATEQWPEALMSLRSHGFQLLALTPASDARLLDEGPPYRSRVAVMVGAEGDGLSAIAMAAADERIRIGMTATADSLNVAVAASIALHYLRPRSRGGASALPTRRGGGLCPP